MDRIPIQLYPNAVIAFGSYGAPSAAALRLPALVIGLFTLLGIVGALYVAGALDLSGLTGLGFLGGILAGESKLYQSLQAEKDTLVSEADAIHTAATAAGGFSDEQRKRDDEIASRVTAINTDLARIDRQRQLDRTAPATPVADGSQVAAEPKPFRTLGEQLQAVYAAATQKHRPVNPGLIALNDWHQAQAAASGAQELVGSDGGFAVQSDFEDGLLQRVYQESVLASRCAEREVGPNANGVKYNIIDETSRVDGSRFGGVRAYWTGEAGSLTSSRPKMAVHEITLQKLTGLYYATDEELQDSVALQSGVEQMFPAEFGFKLDDALVRGSGAGMPLGWLNAAPTVSVAKEAGQAAATVLAENVEKMFSRMWAKSMRNAVWYINQDIYPQLFQMQHVIGTGGVPVFMPPGGLSQAPFGTLFGRPIEPIEQASTLGTVGDISLVDLSEYQLVKKGGIAQAASIHVLFTTDETAFRWVLRINGRPKWLSPLTPFKGSATQSPFVTLATRA